MRTGCPRTSGAGRLSAFRRFFEASAFFLTTQPSSCSPGTGYIQGRFSASSFWYARFPAFSVRQGTAACRAYPCACVEKFEPLRGSSGRLFFFSITTFHFFALFAFFAAKIFRRTLSATRKRFPLASQSFSGSLDKAAPRGAALPAQAAAYSLN